MHSLFDRLAGYSSSTLSSFSIDLSSWDTSKVTDMSNMFSGMGYKATSWSIGDISNWDTSNVTTMASMFSSTGRSTTSWSVGNLSAKTVTLSGATYTAWDVSNVTDMSNMFSNAGRNSTS